MTRHAYGALTLTLGLLWAMPQIHPTAQSRLMVDDPDAYAVYAAVLQRSFGSGDKPLTSLAILEETRSQSNCQSKERVDPEWRSVWQAYEQANSVVRFLRSDADLGLPYTLISLATVKELLLKAGNDGTQTRNGWGEAYTSFPNNKLLAVSSVGFDPSKTRAIVALQYNCGLHKESVIRDYDCHGGEHALLVKEEGRWAPANVGACGWIAERTQGRDLSASKSQTEAEHTWSLQW